MPKGPVILLRVGQSWNAPHMVRYGNHTKFYSRTSAGKYPMDVSEIRSAVLAYEGKAQRIARFRDGRLARIVSNEAPVPLRAGLTWVIHLVPLADASCDLPSDRRWAREHLEPLRGAATEIRHNADGLLAHSPRDNQPYGVKYVQLFRNGSIESVFSETPIDPAKKVIHGDHAERMMLNGVRRYLAALEDLAVLPPIIVMLSLLNAKGYALFRECQLCPEPDSPDWIIDRDQVLLPDVAVEDYHPPQLDVVLRPVLDALWQAGGWPKSRNYNTDGRHEDADGQ